MREFIKWLGVNEKIAKIAICIFIFMIFFITTNAMLDSLGFSNYKITYENLKNVNSKTLDYISSWLVSFISFYLTVLLVFSIKDFKKILKFALLFVLGNILTSILFNYVGVQIYIVLFIPLFCFFYSDKKLIYTAYGLISLIFNAVMQYMFYSFKLSGIDLVNLNETTKNILGIDYIITMIVIILIKEIYMNKLRKE
jgi:hypothetical protein